MRKRMSELTERDKELFLEATKQARKRNHGVEWSVIEKKIQDDIDAAFDDERFAKMDPEMAVDAAYARRDFKGVKPDMIDYLLWSLKFVTKSDYVDIPD